MTISYTFISSDSETKACKLGALIWIIRLWWIALLWPVAAVATSPAPTGILTLDSVVVTATRAPADFETGDVDLTRTPSFYTVIEREAFEGRMISLSQVLEKEAGIQVRQFGGIGSFSSVSLRGSSSEQVLIYLDGILLNDASGGGVDLSSISLADVAAIEIFKGTAPIQFGQGAIGGVVNIKTLRAEDGLNGHVSAGYGSFDTWRTSGLFNYKRSRGDLLLHHGSQAWIINPRAQRQEDFKIGSLDLSAYNDQDGIGPEMTSGVIVNNKLFIVLARLNQDDNWNPQEAFMACHRRLYGSHFRRYPMSPLTITIR